MGQLPKYNMLPHCIFPGFVPGHHTDDLLHIGSYSLPPTQLL